MWSRRSRPIVANCTILRGQPYLHCDSVQSLVVLSLHSVEIKCSDSHGIAYLQLTTSNDQFNRIHFGNHAIAMTNHSFRVKKVSIQRLLTVDVQCDGCFETLTLGHSAVPNDASVFCAIIFALRCNWQSAGGLAILWASTVDGCLQWDCTSFAVPTVKIDKRQLDIGGQTVRNLHKFNQWLPLELAFDMTQSHPIVMGHFETPHRIIYWCDDQNQSSSIKWPGYAANQTKWLNYELKHSRDGWVGWATDAAACQI